MSSSRPRSHRTSFIRDMTEDYHGPVDFSMLWSSP